MRFSVGELNLLSFRDAGTQGFEALFQMLLNGSMFRLVIEVVAFPGIGLEIVQLTFAGIHDVANEFVLLGSDSAMGRDLLRIGPFVVLVVPLIAEAGIGVGDKRKNALALHVLWNGNPGQIEHGWSNVDIENHLVADGTGFYAFGVAKHHGNA